MITVFFALFAACAADATEANACTVSVTPFWFTSEEYCEVWMERELPIVLALNGLAAPTLVQVCLGVELPIPEGDPA